MNENKPLFVVCFRVARTATTRLGGPFVLQADMTYFVCVQNSRRVTRKTVLKRGYAFHTHLRQHYAFVQRTSILASLVASYEYLAVL